MAKESNEPLFDDLCLSFLFNEAEDGNQIESFDLSCDDYEPLFDDFCLSFLLNEAKDSNQIESFDLSCYDFYFSSLFNEAGEDNEILSVSDSVNAEELQSQESVKASFICSQNPGNDPISEQVSKEVAGESSRRFCDICIGSKDSDEMFTIPSCNHQFCADCICKHVEITIQKRTGVVKCLGLDCGATLDIDDCREIMHKDVVTMWADILCEALIPPSQKFYCPYKDCLAMLVNDSDKIIRESECPYCWRLFCAQCNVSWHSGVECEEFQKLNDNERGREDLMVYELTKQKEWQRCPNCKFYVEKTEGCVHISCRCGIEFCYACGESWTETHGGCRP